MGQRLRRQAWRDVKVNFVMPDDVFMVGKSKKEAESIRAEEVIGLLRKSFREGPAAAAEAHAAYKSWLNGVVDIRTMNEPMPPAAQRWSEFIGLWWNKDVMGPGGFDDIDGVDFSQVPKQKPKMRIRM
jgi:hypothetical protein